VGTLADDDVVCVGHILNITFYLINTRGLRKFFYFVTIGQD
jgi:hypothetical protein